MTTRRCWRCCSGGGGGLCSAGSACSASGRSARSPGSGRGGWRGSARGGANGGELCTDRCSIIDSSVVDRARIAAVVVVAIVFVVVVVVAVAVAVALGGAAYALPRDVASFLQQLNDRRVRQDDVGRMADNVVWCQSNGLTSTSVQSTSCSSRSTSCRQYAMLLQSLSVATSARGAKPKNVTLCRWAFFFDDDDDDDDSGGGGGVVRSMRRGLNKTLSFANSSKTHRGVDLLTRTPINTQYQQNFK